MAPLPYSHKFHKPRACRFANSAQKPVELFNKFFCMSSNAFRECLLLPVFVVHRIDCFVNSLNAALNARQIKYTIVYTGITIIRSVCLIQCNEAKWKGRLELRLRPEIILCKQAFKAQKQGQAHACFLKLSFLDNCMPELARF